MTTAELKIIATDVLTDNWPAHLPTTDAERIHWLAEQLERLVERVIAIDEGDGIWGCPDCELCEVHYEP